MFTLRLQRQGKKKDFIFRIVAVDSRVSSRSGKVKEICGWFNPKNKKSQLNKEKIVSWIKKGAQPSVSCHNLLVKTKVIEGKKIPVSLRKKKIKKQEKLQQKVVESPKEDNNTIVGEEAVIEKTASRNTAEDIVENTV